MLSHGWLWGVCGIVLHGHASPRETPPIETRVDGQMGLNPSIRTSHNVGNGTIGIDEANVDG